LIAHWPRGIKSVGQWSDQPSHLVDIAATLIDIADSEYPKDATALEGKSLLPAFSHQKIQREAIFWEHEGNRAVRQANWKLVAKHNQPWELYDLSKDRIEANDLAKQHPERVSQMAKLYQDYARRANVAPWPLPKSVKD